jgi:asparagine synthase (glutamine-hydrolysing)
MCGILGIIGQVETVSNKNVKESLLKISHRGPDCQEILEIDKNCILGHVRLSIIDLSKSGNQPFVMDDRYYLTYNGEIFNYLELKEELSKLGHDFKTNSDTEVVLAAYKYWGESCVTRFNGMWAFGIYDKLNKKTFLSRDRFGIKPLYYCIKNNFLIFSSEIKAILNLDLIDYPEPNLSIIYGYMYYNTGMESNETWFKDIFRLDPAHNISYHNGKIIKTKYYTHNSNKKLTPNIVKSFKKILNNAIHIRLRSDVEVASTLSSGLDSSIISIVAKQSLKKIKTFTAYSPSESYSNHESRLYRNDSSVLDESIVVKKCYKIYNFDHKFIKITNDNFHEYLKKSIYHLECGHSSTAICSASQIYEKVKNLNIKVLLEGQGADEVLGGYITSSTRYIAWEFIKKLQLINLVKFIIILKNNYSLVSILKSNVNELFSNNYIFNRLKKYLMGSNISKYSFNKTKKIESNDHLVSLQKNGLVNLLGYADKLSMANSIEVRLPFMDFRLIDFANKLQLNDKIKGIRTKHILRESFSKELPDEVYNSKLKIGFTTPINDLLQTISVKKILKRDSKLKFIDNFKKNLLIENFYKNKFSNSDFIYRILSVLIWEELYFKEK